MLIRTLMHVHCTWGMFLIMTRVRIIPLYTVLPYSMIQCTCCPTIIKLYNILVTHWGFLARTNPLGEWYQVWAPFPPPDRRIATCLINTYTGNMGNTSKIGHNLELWTLSGSRAREQVHAKDTSCDEMAGSFVGLCICAICSNMIFGFPTMGHKSFLSLFPYIPSTVASAA